MIRIFQIGLYQTLIKHFNTFFSLSSLFFSTPFFSPAIDLNIGLSIMIHFVLPWSRWVCYSVCVLLVRSISSIAIIITNHDILNPKLVHFLDRIFVLHSIAPDNFEKTKFACPIWVSRLLRFSKNLWSSFSLFHILSIGSQLRDRLMDLIHIYFLVQELWSEVYIQWGPTMFVGLPNFVKVSDLIIREV